MVANSSSVQKLFSSRWGSECRRFQKYGCLYRSSALEIIFSASFKSIFRWKKTQKITCNTNSNRRKNKNKKEQVPIIFLTLLNFKSFKIFFQSGNIPLDLVTYHIIVVVFCTHGSFISDMSLCSDGKNGAGSKAKAFFSA